MPDWKNDDERYERMMKLREALDRDPLVKDEEKLVNLSAVLGDEKVSVTTCGDVNASGDPMLWWCLRCEDSRPDDVVPGSVKGTCMVCKRPVWLAPSSQKVMKKLDKFHTACLQCIPDAAKAIKDAAEK